VSLGEQFLTFRRVIFSLSSESSSPGRILSHIGNYSPRDTWSLPRRLESSAAPLEELKIFHIHITFWLNIFPLRKLSVSLSTRSAIKKTDIYVFRLFSSAFCFKTNCKHDGSLTRVEKLQTCAKFI